MYTLDKTITVLLFCIVSTSLKAQFLWPIKDYKAGQGIVAQPQDFIGKELNYEDMFISAPEGTAVVAPCDASITDVSITFLPSLTQSQAFGCNAITFDAMRKKLEGNKQVAPLLKYYNGSLTLNLPDGRRLHIGGLRGSKAFKTGQNVKQGEQLGTVAYAFRNISRPCISLSLSTKQGKPADPMAPFGLKSTFKPAKPIVSPKTLTAQQAKEDIDFLLQAMKECYPSYSDMVTEERLQAFKAKAEAQIRPVTSYTRLYDIVRQAITRQLINDSHIWINTPSPRLTGNIFVPHILLGSVQGKLIVTAVQPGYERYLSKEVASVDKTSAKDLIEYAADFAILFDQHVASKLQAELLSGWNYYFHNQLGAKTSTIKFTDGTSIKDTWIPIKQSKRQTAGSGTPAYDTHVATNSRVPFSFKKVDAATMLFTIGTFELDQTQLEAIADTLKQIKDMPNLIVDVRDNGGGEDEVLTKLASMLILGPTKPMQGYTKVNSNSTYKSFAHCENFSADMTLFDQYKPREGKEGFYLENEDTGVIQPHSSVNYKGNVVVLINENSLSAATLFPAILVKNHRAVAIGRETGTAYHYMTALKFAKLVLPHSKISITVPLVKCVYDEEVSERFPAGRGLLPDIEVPLTYEERFTAAADVILARALEYLKHGK